MTTGIALNDRVRYTRDPIRKAVWDPGRMHPALPFNLVGVNPIAKRGQTSRRYHLFSHLDHLHISLIESQHGYGVGFVGKKLAAEHAFEIPDHIVEGLFNPETGEFVFVVRFRKGLLDHKGIGEALHIEEHVFDSPGLEALFIFFGPVTEII